MQAHTQICPKNFSVPHYAHTAHTEEDMNTQEVTWFPDGSVWTTHKGVMLRQVQVRVSASEAVEMYTAWGARVRLLITSAKNSPEIGS
jgi:hypothetical protein